MYIKESILTILPVPRKQTNKSSKETFVFILFLFLLMDDGEPAGIA